MKAYKEYEESPMQLSEPAVAYGVEGVCPPYEEPTEAELLRWVKEVKEEECLGLTMTTQQVHDWINRELGWN